MGESQISRVLILYTGGTIGMKITPRGYAPVKGFLQQQLFSMPQFHDPTQDELTTPPSNLGQRIRYEIKEYNPLLDSVNMQFQDWAKIATDIEENYDRFDAFIVLHGTDTMAYATSALSFMLVNLSKPVIVTGSQLPLSEIRNDAATELDKLVLLLADNPNIQIELSSHTDSRGTDEYNIRLSNKRNEATQV